MLLKVSALDFGPKGGAVTGSHSHFIYGLSIPTHALSFRLGNIFLILVFWEPSASSYV